MASNNSIYFDSIDINNIELNCLRKKLIALSEQDTCILNQSININLYLDQKKECNDKLLYELLYFLNFKYKYNELNNKIALYHDYDKLLSGGEKQKISIIRTILKDAPILIFDEPTSALDIQSINGLKIILRNIRHEKIIIIITHGNDLDDIAQNIINF